jgi:hypothetical protein
MATLKGLQDVNTIQQRLISTIKGNPETIIEGSFKRDIINATSEEFKNAYFEIDLVKDSAFAATSWGEYLTAKCSDMGIDRKLAVKAHGEVTVTGNANAWIPAKSLFQSDSGYKFYTTQESFIDDNGTATIPIEAENSGTEYNLEANTITLIPMSIGGINSVTNANPTIDGFNEETDEALYQRYSDFIRQPATSGNIFHYNQWATSVSGVGGCRVTELVNGPGTVGVAIVDSNGDKASQDLINKVKAYIELKRPAGAKVIVSTPEILTININVTGLVGTGTEEAFKKLLAEYFRTHGFKLTKVSQADIVKQLFNAGYTDYNSIQINSTNGSVALNGKLPKIGTVVFNG